jgi:hypothetical protein
MPTKTALCLAACLLLPACDGGAADARLAAAREYADFLQQEKLADAQRAAEQARTHGRLAAIDPCSLISKDEVARILVQRRASGDGTDTAIWHVDIQREVLPPPPTPDLETVGCTVHWRSSDAAGQTGAQGSFRIEVQGRWTWDMVLAGGKKHLAGIGDDAVIDGGTPYALVDGLCLGVPNGSSTELSLLALRCAAPRLQQALAAGPR